jgi:ubiquinone biosynthesis protein
MGAKPYLGNDVVLTQLLALVPAPQHATLVALLGQEAPSPEETGALLSEVLETVDWETQRDQVGTLLSQLLPLESLVPEVYSEWRPVIRAAVAFLGARLSPHRLVPKLVAQMLLPVDVPLARRLLPLVAFMPTLQKLGQVIARNQYLASDLRDELTQLENSIGDFSAPAGHSEVRQQLAPQLAAYNVELADDYLAEASVSVVIPFTWINPATHEREQGVFKVLKPYVGNYLTEELELLDAFVRSLGTLESTSRLAQAHIQEVFDDIRQLLAQEINFAQEQANMQAAAVRYADIPGVSIPRLILEMCTPTITASVRMPGVKVTAVSQTATWQRQCLARRLVTALVFVPLLTADEDSVFHADPHAGNLLCEQNTGTVAILDWALTGRLSRPQRQQLLLLAIALSLRDEGLLFRAIAQLSEENVTTDSPHAAMIRQEVRQCIRSLSGWAIPGMRDALILLDQVALAGLHFPSALVVFRKALFTLEGVIHDLIPGVKFDAVLTGAVLGLSWPWQMPMPISTLASFLCSSLSLQDWLAVYTSLSTYGTRYITRLGHGIN